MEKWLILGFRQGIYKMSLQTPAVPESKKMLNKQNDGGGVGVKGIHTPTWKYSQKPKINNLSRRINYLTYYNAEHKIHISEPIVI